MSVMVSDPVAPPAAVGVKVTEKVQFDPAVTELPQVFVWAKLGLIETLLMVRGAVPGLLSVIV